MLLLSPVPMVRGFGLLLVVGIAVAFGCALTAGSAAIALATELATGAGRRPRDSLRGAREILRDARAIVRDAAAGVRRTIGPRVAAVAAALAPPRARCRAGARSRHRRPDVVIRHPGRVLALGAVLAVLGWVADTQTSVQSDVTKLVPSSMPALRDLHTLERVTGVSGEIDVTVHAHNVATPSIVGWMIRYENTLMTHYGYLETKGCAHSTLCPALSLPDLFSTGGQSGQSQGLVASFDRQPAGGGSGVLLAGGDHARPSQRDARLRDPPDAALKAAAGDRLHALAAASAPGVTAQLAGLPVLAAEANAALSSSGRRLLTLLAGLLAVGVVLLAVFRSAERALVPLVPIALATGWSALILFAIGIPLNPMSATLGALVIAISTEFSVLLSERFRQERAAGHDLAEALARTYRSTGAAVLASGITAIAGFGVLVLSSITMLRDFGFVTLIDLTVSLAGVLLVLPAVLVVSERGDLLRARAGSRVAPARCCRGCGGGRGRVSGTRPARTRRIGSPSRAGSRSIASTPTRPSPQAGGPPAETRRAGDRHAALPLDDRDLRAGAADRLLGL